MTKRKLFLYLAAVAGYIGIGLLLGYALSDQTKNAALWVGILLVLVGALLLGMFISARGEAVVATKLETSPTGAPPTSSKV